MAEQPVGARPQSERAEQYDEFHRLCIQVFRQRNRQYGDAIRIGGLIGAAIEVMGNAARLHTLAIKTPYLHPEAEVPVEAIRDTLIDVANYAAIAYMMLDDKNYLGGF